jgi:hypothetical protein
MLCGSPHDPLRSPIVEPGCFGGNIDRYAGTVCSQHSDHSLDMLHSDTACNHLGRKVCIGVCNFCINRCRVGCTELCSVPLVQSQCRAPEFVHFRRGFLMAIIGP